MHIQKRAVGASICDESVHDSSISNKTNQHKCWRRFMNERTNRAYVPTAHGRIVFFHRLIIFLISSLEHAANCLTHGVLIIPSFIAAQRLIARAKIPAEYWSSIIYGNALILLFSFSTVFHCSCFHPTYR